MCSSWDWVVWVLMGKVGKVGKDGGWVVRVRVRRESRSRSDSSEGFIDFEKGVAVWVQLLISFLILLYCLI